MKSALPTMPWHPLLYGKCRECERAAEADGLCDPCRSAIEREAVLNAARHAEAAERRSA